MSRLPLFRSALLATLCLCGVVLAPRSGAAQAPSREMLDRGHRMLAQIDKDLRAQYFDSTFGGRDMAAHLRTADAAISAAPTINHVLAAIAQYVSELGDSHTNFLPPDHADEYDFGYRTLFVGDTCFITSVKAKSDAELKGIKRGDALLKLDAFPVTRESFGTIQYVYERLSPRSRVRLTVRGTNGEERVVDLDAAVRRGARNLDLENVETIYRLIDDYDTTAVAINQIAEIGDSVVVWKMRQFELEEQGNIDVIMKKARRGRALVLDLRNNPGGFLVTLDYVLGQFFDQPVTIGSKRRRASSTPWSAKPSTSDPFRGMLVVLVNSNSASSSEIFSRVMQLEGRGIIVGDLTAGAVVTAQEFNHTIGSERKIPYGTQISVQDVVMADGQRLERVGVTPDHVVLPSGADIAARRDPQLAKALSLVGVSVTPELAGSIFRPSARQTGDR